MSDTTEPRAGDALQSVRGRIDAVDRELVRLLAERLAHAREIGAIKSESKEGVRDGARERDVAAAWSELAAAEGLPEELARQVLGRVLEHSRRRQEPLVSNAATKIVRVGYQGAAGAYSELAIGKLFDSRGIDVDAVALASFVDVFDALEAGRVDAALVPIENSIVGGLAEVGDLLCERSLCVLDEEVYDVEHCLAALPGQSLSEIRRVRSHPVALAQCTRTLRDLGLEVEAWFDTAGAAAAIAAEGATGVAAVCAEAAALRHGLEVLQRQLGDRDGNRTRFMLLGREPEELPRGVDAKTSLLVAVDHRAGALARCLQALADHGVNLTRLESRPQPGRGWEYRFFIDFEGHPDEQRIDAALRALRGHVNHLRLLGTYPNRTRSPDAPVLLPKPSTTAVEVPAPPLPRTEPNRSGPPLVSLPETGQRTVVHVGGVAIGGTEFTLILGPCAVESREQVAAAAAMVAARGAHLLRGGAFKPRSSPYSFRGHGFEGLDLLVEAGRAHGLPVVTEVMRAEDVPGVAAKADVLQIGARNMQNFPLLEAVGGADRPVLLKRGAGATLTELLQAAEYVLAKGNPRVVLCERGIRTFETATRATLDVSAVPVLKERTHLPVIVDPSHAAGRRELVVPLALAAAAVGADGLIVEAHPDPDSALCDKEQALTPADLDELMRRLKPILADRPSNPG